MLSMTNGRAEHLTLAELTARIHELVGGLVNAELHPEQIGSDGFETAVGGGVV